MSNCRINSIPNASPSTKGIVIDCPGALSGKVYHQPNHICGHTILNSKILHPEEYLTIPYKRER